MSLVDGSDFVVYHGELRRRSRRALGLRPAVEYQVTAMAWAAISNGTGAEHGVPQAPDQGGFDGLGLAVAGDRDLREFRSYGQSRQGWETLSLPAGPSGPAVRSGGRPCRAASLRSRVVQEIPAGRPFSSPPA